MQNWLNEKQALLLRAAFSEDPTALNDWHNRYNNSDLDQQTRTILPSLLERSNTSSAKQTEFARYQAYYHHTWINNLQKFSAFRKTLQALTESGIVPCLLKGGAMLSHFYKNMGMRPVLQDIDLLVRQEDLSNAITVLRKEGFFPLNHFKKTGVLFEKEVLETTSGLLRYHHAITYTDGKQVIDLHWRLTPILPQCTWAFLRPHMNTITLYQSNVLVLNPLYQFMHLCVHGMSQNSPKASIHWIVDIFYLLKFWSSQYEKSAFVELTSSLNIAPYFEQMKDLVSNIAPELASSFPTTYPSHLSYFQRQLYKAQFARSPLYKRFGHYALIYLAANRNLDELSDKKRFFQFTSYYFGLATALETIKFLLEKIKLRLNKESSP